MKFFPLLSAVSLGASAAIIAVDTVERASAPDLDDPIEVEGLLVKRGRGGDSSSSGSDGSGRNEYGGKKPLGTGKTGRVSKNSKEVQVAKALAGDRQDALRADAAEGSKSLGQGVKKLDKPLDRNAYTGESAVYKEWDKSLGGGQGGYKVKAYEGGSKAGGAHSANLDLYSTLGGVDPMNPPSHRRATATEKKNNRKITQQAGSTNAQGRLTNNEDQWASLNKLSGMPRIVNQASTRESSRSQAPVAKMVSGITSQYPASQVQRIPNALPDGQPKSNYAVGPAAFDNRGIPMMPRVIVGQEDFSMARAGEGITPYTGKAQPEKVIRPDGTSYKPGKTGPKYVPPKGKKGKGKGKASDSESEKRSTPVLAPGLMHKPLMGRQLPSMPSTGDASGANLTAQYEEALQDEFDWITDLQNNITDLIWPILLDLTDEAQGPEMYIMAMSIWSDLVSGPLLVGSPYWNGMTTLMDLTPTTPADALSQAYLVNSYEDAWDNATALISAAGYDVSLEGFFNLTDVNDTSLLPPTPSNWNETLDQVFAAFWPAATDNSTEPIYTTASPEYQAWSHNVTVGFLNSTNLTDLLPPSARPNITLADFLASNSNGTNSTGTDSTGTNSTGTDSTGTNNTGTDSTGTNSTGTDSTGNSSTAINKRRGRLVKYLDRQV